MNETTGKIDFKQLLDRIPDCRPVWQDILEEAVREPAELCRRLGISTQEAEMNPDFPMVVPETFWRRIKPGDPNDPLLLQVLPRKAESAVLEGFTTDPLQENQNVSPTGILSKYQGRSLIVTGRACGVHCRFCFRRHLPLPRDGEGEGRFTVDPEAIAAQLSVDPEIHEVILSGGDPLMMSDLKLSTLIHHLDQVPHLRRIRIHTRLPVVIPHRVTEDLLAVLSNQKRWGMGGRRLVVLHVNHANELDGRVYEAIENLINCGCNVLSQTVLLRGVNDTVPALKTLFEALVDSGVVPYYLHQLDRVAGAAHFEVPVKEGCRLMAQLRAELPGYAVPRYVREIPGAPGKVVLI